MFGLGMWEIIVILVIVIVIFGPKRIPELARSLGKGMREFRKASTELQSAVRDMDSPDTQLRQDFDKGKPETAASHKDKEQAPRKSEQEASLPDPKPALMSAPAVASSLTGTHPKSDQLVEAEFLGKPQAAAKLQTELQVEPEEAAPVESQVKPKEATPVEVCPSPKEALPPDTHQTTAVKAPSEEVRSESSQGLFRPNFQDQWQQRPKDESRTTSVSTLDVRTMTPGLNNLHSQFLRERRLTPQIDKAAKAPPPWDPNLDAGWSSMFGSSSKEKPSGSHTPFPKGRPDTTPDPSHSKEPTPAPSSQSTSAQEAASQPAQVPPSQQELSGHQTGEARPATPEAGEQAPVAATAPIDPRRDHVPEEIEEQAEDKSIEDLVQEFMQETSHKSKAHQSPKESVSKQPQMDPKPEPDPEPKPELEAVRPSSQSEATATTAAASDSKKPDSEPENNVDAANAAEPDKVAAAPPKKKRRSQKNGGADAATTTAKPRGKGKTKGGGGSRRKKGAGSASS